MRLKLLGIIALLRTRDWLLYTNGKTIGVCQPGDNYSLIGKQIEAIRKTQK